MVILGYLVGYIEVTGSPRAKLVMSKYPTEHPNLTPEPSVTSMYPTKHPNLVLEPFVTSMDTTGYPNLAKDPSVMPHYKSVLIIRQKKLTWPSLFPCSP
jgi:hypothetical protein